MVWLQDNGPEGLSWDTFHYVYELVQKGNLAFRDNRMEEVMKIVCFIFGYSVNCSSECSPFIYEYDYCQQHFLFFFLYAKCNILGLTIE